MVENRKPIAEIGHSKKTWASAPPPTLPLVAGARSPANPDPASAERRPDPYRGAAAVATRSIASSVALARPRTTTVSRAA